MGRVDERPEIIEGLSGDEAWRCLCLVAEDEREHDDALHADDPPPPVSEGARREVQAILPTLGEPEAAIARGDSPANRRPPYADDERVRSLLLVMLKSVDRHWGERHPDQPKPGVEYLLGLVNRARIHGRY
jgi:hypothetical protein